MYRGMAKTAREQGFDEIVVRAGLPLKIAAKN